MISPADFSSPFQNTRAKTVGATDRATASRQEALHDIGLVRRFNAGDESAFVEIIHRYRERMFAVAFGLLKNRADAEEIAQDTLIRAHRGLARFRGDSSLATWMHRIAMNLARNRYWYFFRRRRHTSFSLDRAFGDDNQGSFADLVATEELSPAREAAAGEFSELVDACMQRLGKPQREILTLRNARNHSYSKIAGELGINVGTVKSRIARARENLRALLAEACPEFGPEAQPTAWFDPIRPAGGVAVICA
ncbi:MAG: sigma-70 family RNA polymerase sigma factor [Undibacterium sp.]|nr:sigma-70 family RNA polymerase sigma factor [Opitutaceae bacterium]